MSLFADLYWFRITQIYHILVYHDHNVFLTSLNFVLYHFYWIINQVYNSTRFRSWIIVSHIAISISGVHDFIEYCPVEMYIMSVCWTSVDQVVHQKNMHSVCICNVNSRLYEVCVFLFCANILNENLTLLNVEQMQSVCLKTYFLCIISIVACQQSFLPCDHFIHVTMWLCIGE